jgi:hypothetical protein
MHELFRIAVTDSRPRFQVPIQIPSEGALPSDPLYDVTFTASPSFGIRVIRRSSGELILGEQYRAQRQRRYSIIAVG